MPNAEADDDDSRRAPEDPGGHRVILGYTEVLSPIKIIENVPAEICQQCGEKYIKAEVYKEMERLARGPTTAARPVSKLN